MQRIRRDIACSCCHARDVCRETSQYRRVLQSLVRSCSKWQLRPLRDLRLVERTLSRGTIPTTKAAQTIERLSSRERNTHTHRDYLVDRERDTHRLSSRDIHTHTDCLVQRERHTETIQSTHTHTHRLSSRETHREREIDQTVPRSLSLFLSL